VRIKRIHRITLAVNDVDVAARTFEELLDERAAEPHIVRDFLIRAVDIPLGDSTLQLAAPLPSNNPVRNFLQRKGEGLYNIAVEVEDLDGALVELSEMGVRVSEPVEAEPGVRSAFVAMSATHGLSLQLVEIDRARGEPITEPVVREDEPRAEHLAPDDTPPPPVQPDPPRLLDLSVDEWSDTD
jgi:hypothetical protein